MAWMRQGIKGKSKNANAAITVDARNDLHAGAKTDASVSNTQTACHNKSKRIAADGVTVGTISGEKYQALVGERDDILDELDVLKKQAKENWTHAIHLDVAALNKVYLAACAAVSKRK